MQDCLQQLSKLYLSLNGLSGLDFGNLQLANNSVYVSLVVQNYNSFNGFF